MTQIVCLSHTPWSAQPTRTQQLLSRMAGTEILFFQPFDPASPAGPRKVRPNVVVYPLPRPATLAGHTSAVARFNRSRDAACINKAMSRHRFRAPLLWCTSPEQVHQLSRLARRGLVYDCHRYWSNFPIEWEGELAAAADVCFAASDGLVDRLSPCNENIVLLPNGVNFPLFSRQPGPPPAPLAHLQGRLVLGLTGDLHTDTDLSPLLLAARVHPEWVFLHVGGVDTPELAARLKRIPNLLLAGRRPMVELPDYLACCDVCLHLLRRREEDSDVIPSRIYAYLAAGKQVVAMLWKYQRQEFPDVVRGARTAEEFVAQCERALLCSAASQQTRRRDYGAAAAWDRRTAQVIQILETNGLWTR